MLKIIHVLPLKTDEQLRALAAVMFVEKVSHAAGELNCDSNHVLHFHLTIRQSKPGSLRSKPMPWLFANVGEFSAKSYP